MAPTVYKHHISHIPGIRNFTMSHNKHKKHKIEQMVAWIATIIITAIIVTAVFFGVKFLKTPVSKGLNAVFAPASSQVEPEEINPEPVEEETVDEGLDEDSLSKIFDKEEDEEDKEEEPEEEKNDILMEKANEILENMSIEQQVAQMFFVDPESLTGVEIATAAGEKTRLALLEHPVGGILMSSKNIENAEQLKTMNSNLQKFSREILSLPIFIGVKEEGGEQVVLAGSSELLGEEAPEENAESEEESSEEASGKKDESQSDNSDEETENEDNPNEDEEGNGAMVKKVPSM